MTLELVLPPELEARISYQAEQMGITPLEYVLQRLDACTPAPQKNAEAIALLQSWIDTDDPEEQKETGDFLIEALDKDRLSPRPLFPPEMKGITW